MEVRFFAGNHMSVQPTTSSFSDYHKMYENYYLELYIIIMYLHLLGAAVMFWSDRSGIV